MTASWRLAVASPRIVIPHGLAADVLRVLSDGTPRTCGQIADAIDHLSVGFTPVWRQLHEMACARVLTRTPSIHGTTWEVRRG